MTILRPTEYVYLASPFLSEGSDMIKTTLQELCLKGVLNVEERYVYLRPNAKRKRRRYFLVKGDQFKSYTTELRAEKFMLDAFEARDELSHSGIRHYVKEHFPKHISGFKNEYVWPDLEEKDLCVLRYFATSNGKRSRKELAGLLEDVNANIDTLIAHSTALSQKLNALGQNVILLERETLKKLQEIDKKVLDLGLLNFSAIAANLDHPGFIGYIDTFDSFTYFDFGTDASGFDGFDGFDGGDFGGGGADGGW